MEARIAHDLNNLLLLIRGNAEMLCKEAPPESTTRARGEQIVAASVEALRLTREVAAADGRCETVLIVEEDDAVRELAHEILEREGYTVLQAADGATAAATAHAFGAPIDLVLTDRRWPASTFARSRDSCGRRARACASS